MKVLSLFDGMACGMLAFKAAGLSVSRYVAYEIDKYAVQTSSHNFPMIEHKGDVFHANFTEYFGFDFVLAGFPCTKFSIAQKNDRETQPYSGEGWLLFEQSWRAVCEAKPMYFVFENNKSMAKPIQKEISRIIGFEPICINSALVSAQNRKRIYWVGRRNEDGTYSQVLVSQPKDKGILLRDILESGVVDREKAYPLLTTAQTDSMVCEPIFVGEVPEHKGTYRNGKQASQQYRVYDVNGKGVAVTTTAITNVAEPIRIGTIESSLKNCKHDSKQYRVYSPDGKGTTLCGQGGGVGAKTGLYAIPATGKEKPIYEVKDGLITIKGKQYPIKLADGFYIIRKLTVTECKRLQTVPDWYVFPVSNAQAYKMLGNGWTVDVIAHLITSTKENKNGEYGMQWTQQTFF